MILRMHISTEQRDQFEAVEKVISHRETTPRIGIEQRGTVMPLPVGPHAVALHHEHGHPLHEDSIPDMFAVAMQRNGERTDLGAYFRETPCRRFDQFIHILL